MSKPKVDHIGVLVPDMDKAIAMFSKLFGMAPDSTQDRSDVGVRIAMFETANVTIELLAYTDPDHNFAKDTMGGTMGINHVCFAVDDVDESIRHMQDNGMEMMDGFPIQGAHGRVAFFDKAKTDGFLFEVCQPD